MLKPCNSFSVAISHPIPGPKSRLSLISCRIARILAHENDQRSTLFRQGSRGLLQIWRPDVELDAIY